MKFSELNPMLGKAPESEWHHLVFDCPQCRRRTGISVSLDGQPKQAHVWGLALPSSYSWDDVTITPSINNPPHGKDINCQVHLSVTKGEVLP